MQSLGKHQYVVVAWLYSSVCRQHKQQLSKRLSFVVFLLDAVYFCWTTCIISGDIDLTELRPGDY